MRISPRPLYLAGLIFGLSFVLLACGGDGEPQPSTAGVAVVNSTETPPPPPTDTATADPEPVATEVVTAVPTEQVEAAPARPTGPPDSGYWIDVDVSDFTVRLMEDTSALQVIGPIAVGAQIDTGIYESTATGLYYVYSMDASLTYDAPYDTYISHWVGFDPALANGFHSFLKDADGNVVDASTGRVSNGCIRTGAAEAIYAFAEIGMPVYVHF
jgi:hypothetical protein